MLQSLLLGACITITASLCSVEHAACPNFGTQGMQYAKQLREHHELLAAIENGDMQSTHALLASGVPARGNNAFSTLPLMRAIDLFITNPSIAPSMAQLLIDHGAEINDRAACSITPLLYAAEKNNLAACRYLLTLGAATDDADYFTHYTALTHAAKHGNVTLVEELLAHGAQVTAIDAPRCLQASATLENQRIACSISHPKKWRRFTRWLILNRRASDYQTCLDLLEKTALK